MMNNIQNINKSKLYMTHIHMQQAIRIRQEIAGYDDTALELHEQAEKKLRRLVTYLEQDVFDESYPNMNVYKRYDRLKDNFIELQEVYQKYYA